MTLSHFGKRPKGTLAAVHLTLAALQLPPLLSSNNGTALDVIAIGWQVRATITLSQHWRISPVTTGVAKVSDYLYSYYS